MFPDYRSIMMARFGINKPQQNLQGPYIPEENPIQAPVIGANKFTGVGLPIENPMSPPQIPGGKFGGAEIPQENPIGPPMFNRMRRNPYTKNYRF